MGLPRTAQRRYVMSIDLLIAAGCAVAVALWFVVTTPEALHWFVLPVTVCGIIMGADAVRWLRGKTDAFDPAGLFGVLGVHLFFLAPLLHVRWNYWMRFVQPPPDWRDWIGAMAILNCLGLAAYRLGRAWLTRSARQIRTIRVLEPRRFWVIVLPVLLIAGLAQYMVYDHVGGFLGYVRAYEQADAAFRGFGFIFLISESFPILAFFAFAVLTTRHPALKSWWVIVIVLCVFFALKIVFGGLRGSRSNTIWGLFWACAIVHLWIRHWPRRALILGLPALAGFMFGYGLYKADGLAGLSALFAPSRAREIANTSGRTFHATLLGDLGRADVQAYLLYRLENGGASQRAWGRTYLGDVAILIPRRVLRDRPAGKQKEGTNLLYGRGSYESGESSRRVFGIAGEAMMNVGAVGIPIAYFLWGAFVGVLRRAYYGLRRADARLLMLPFLLNFALILLIGDGDNAVFFLVKEGSLPFLVLFLATRSVPLPEHTEAQP